MSVWKGNRIEVEIYGESHAEEIGARIVGLPDIAVDESALNAHLSRRKSGNYIGSTARKEADIPLLSYGKTGEIVVAFQNQDIRKADYASLYAKPRPSHADYVRFVKDGVLDFSGGGAFSGRMTAPLCAAGGVALQILKTYGISVAAFVSSVGNVNGLSYQERELSEKELTHLRGDGFPALTNKAQMQEEIARAQSAGDSVGGVVECVVYGLPAGVGDCLFQGLEGKISSLVYAIPAVKGVAFGDGFSLCKMRGSQANDPFVWKEGKVETETNRAGGINGGVSNGMPVTLSVGFRPTPSISLPLRTVDLEKGVETEIRISGRHDACIVPRAVPVVESAVALAILDEVLICGR